MDMPLYTCSDHIVKLAFESPIQNVFMLYFMYSFVFKQCILILTMPIRFRKYRTNLPQMSGIIVCAVFSLVGVHWSNDLTNSAFVDEVRKQL